MPHEEKVSMPADESLVEASVSDIKRVLNLESMEVYHESLTPLKSSS